MSNHLSQLSTLQGVESAVGVGHSLVPALTILAHPQASRVGDRVWLQDLVGPGRPVELSRSGPDFSPPGGGAATPLRSPLLSRSPVTLTKGLSGQWMLEPGPMAGRVYLDGVLLSEPARVDQEQLRRGVVIRLGRHAAVLWHLANPGLAVSPKLGLLGESDAVNALRERICNVARSKASVLIRGETGSGKELVAQAIHSASGRSGRFVALNLGAIPQSLAASELFGHTRGAFTGAKTGRDGYFVQAMAGTLLLDEVGDAPDEVQVALLRVLETGSIQAVGAERMRSVDVRVVAATDADLEHKMGVGSFRAPLYHRLATHLIDVPPLRDRRSDVARLLVHFLRIELAEMGKHGLLETDPLGKKVWLSAKLVDRLVREHWAGNVRQLRNVARYLATTSGPLSESDPNLVRLLSPPRPVEVEVQPVRRRPRHIGQDELGQVLKGVDWELGRAARHFGISRPALNGLVDKHSDLKRAKFLTDAEIEDGRVTAATLNQALWSVLRVSKRGLSRRLSGDR